MGMDIYSLSLKRGLNEPLAHAISFFGLIYGLVTSLSLIKFHRTGRLIILLFQSVSLLILLLCNGILINYLIRFRVGYCIKYGAYLSLLCMLLIHPFGPLIQLVHIRYHPRITGFEVRPMVLLFLNFLENGFGN